MKKTTKIISYISFVIFYLLFLSLGMEALLQFFGAGFHISPDNIPNPYPRYTPFCLAVGLFATLMLGVVAFFNAKYSERLGYTKRWWIFQSVLVFVLSLGLTELWRRVFELLHKVF